jgi:hypothetical protein
VFLGPELFWLVFYSILVLVIQFTHAPDQSLDEGWVSMAYRVPLLVIPLSFGLYWLPFGHKKLLLLRLAISSILGSHFVLEKGLAAHSQQDPGVGTAYILGMLLSLVISALLTIGLLIKELFFSRL